MTRSTLTRLVPVIAVALISVAGLNLSGCGGSGGASATATLGLTWQNPLPSPFQIHGLWGSSASNVYAACDRSSVLRWDGFAWQEVHVGETVAYHAVWGSSASDVFVVGDNGAIIHFDGTSWTSMTSGTAARLRAVWGSGPGDVYAAGDGATLLRFDGSGWSSAKAAKADIGYRAVWCSGDDDVVFGGNDGYVNHKTSTGIQPYTGVTGTITAMHGFGAALDVVIVDDVGKVYRFDRTAVAEVATQPGAGPLHAVWGTSPSDLYVASSSSVLHWNGATWSTAVTNTDGYWTTLWGTADGELFCGGGATTGPAAGLLHRTDGTWAAEFSSVADVYLNDVRCISDTLTYAVGDSGTVLRHDGLSWTAVADHGATSDLRGVWASGAGDVFVVGASGTIRHFDGTSWQVQDQDSTIRFNAVLGTSATNVYAVGDRSGPPAVCLHYDGTSWSPVATSAPTNLTSIRGLWIDPATGTLVCAGSTATGAGVYTHDGDTWTQLTAALLGSCMAVAGTSLSNLYACGMWDNEIFRYDGSAWTKVADFPGRYVMKFWARTADDIWAVGYDNGISRWNGTEWTTVQFRDSGLEFLSVHGTSASNAFIVGDGGEILHWGPVN